LSAEREKETGGTDEDGHEKADSQELSGLEFFFALDLLSPFEVCKMDTKSIP